MSDCVSPCSLRISWNNFAFIKPPPYRVVNIHNLNKKISHGICRYFRLKEPLLYSLPGRLKYKDAPPTVTKSSHLKGSPLPLAGVLLREVPLLSFRPSSFPLLWRWCATWCARTPAWLLFDIAPLLLN